MQQDITLTGDSKNKIWRPFNKQYLSDGVNDDLKTIELCPEVRVGKSFSISLWTDFLSLNGAIYPPSLITSCLYGHSSNGLVTPARQINEVAIYVNQNNVLIINILARIGATDFNSGFAIIGGSVQLAQVLNKKYHIVFTNTFDGVENYWTIYVNSIKMLQGTTVFFSNPLPTPPASGYNLAPDPNYLFGVGAFLNRNNYNPYYTNSKVNELIITQNVLTNADVRKLYHCGAGNYANYPTSIMTNQLLHLPMNNASDFFYDGINLRANDISVGNNDPIITGQGTTATLANFY